MTCRWITISLFITVAVLTSRIYVNGDIDKDEGLLKDDDSDPFHSEIDEQKDEQNNHINTGMLALDEGSKHSSKSTKRRRIKSKRRKADDDDNDFYDWEPFGHERRWEPYGNDRFWVPFGHDQNWVPFGSDSNWEPFGDDKNWVPYGADSDWTPHGIKEGGYGYLNDDGDSLFTLDGLVELVTDTGHDFSEDEIHKLTDKAGKSKRLEGKRRQRFRESLITYKQV